MKRTKIYVSIPISGLDVNKVREKADLIKNRLSREGYDVVLPFDVYAGKNPTYEDHICYDLLSMLDCDAILFCEGWDQSLGCNIEYNTAMLFKAHNKKDFKIMLEQS